MAKYKEVRKIILSILQDGQWHVLDELQRKCEQEGISFEDGRGPLYNVTHQLKVKGIIEADGIGGYKIYNQKEQICEGKSVTSDLTTSLKNIDLYIMKYKKFDWINCSDEELQDARNKVGKMLELAQKINSEFRRTI